MTDRELYFEKALYLHILKLIKITPLLPLNIKGMEESDKMSEQISKVSIAVRKTPIISILKDEISVTDFHTLQVMVVTRARSHIKKQFKRAIF
jgi:hypothetical protein